MADSQFKFVTLLLLGNGADASTTVTDSGPDKRTVTVLGNAQIDTAQSKFGGASILFDGTGDYLTLNDEPGLQLNTGDFTIEFWVRLNSTAATATIVNKALTTGNSQYRIYFDSTVSKFGAYTRDAASTGNLVCTSPSTATTGVWYHIAFVRSGDNFTLYQDGSPSTVQTRSGALFTSAETVSIAGNSNGGVALNGWLDDIRITKGVARYTASFTPPTAELETGTAPGERYFSSVGLLLHCDGTDASTTFTDKSANAYTVTAVGNAQVDTADSKFGGASALFDGTGDYLTVPNATPINVSDATPTNWTVELWIKLSSAASNVIIAQQATGTGSYPWQLWFESSTNKFGFRGFNAGAGSSYAMQQTGTSTTGVWYHLAGVRDGNTFRFFVDGVANGTATLSGALFSTTQTLSFGAANNGSAPLTGWLDDIRFTKGVARYTGTFTPPAAAHPDGNDILGYIQTPAILGGSAGVLALGGILNRGTISTDAILGGSVGAKLFGSLVYGKVLMPAILGGTPGPKIFGSLVFGKVLMPAILGTPLALGVHDFTSSITNAKITYTMDLITDITTDARVRVPISSWQSTQQVTNQCYLGCVIPACEPWLTTLQTATYFAIQRRVQLDTGEIVESEMARAPIETLQTDQGPRNYTASISGYTPAFASNPSPPTSTDRTLTGVRSISVYDSGVRIRCAIDWLLRPSQRATYGSVSFIVSYINYYVTANTASVDEYMDVGERVETA